MREERERVGDSGEERVRVGDSGEERERVGDSGEEREKVVLSDAYMHTWTEGMSTWSDCDCGLFFIAHPTHLGQFGNTLDWSLCKE